MIDVTFRPDAEKDLNALFEYISSDAGVRIAADYVDRIEAACLSLSRLPERGRKRDDLAEGLRTIGFERRVTIAYRVSIATIESVAIVYGGRDLARRVRSLT